MTSDIYSFRYEYFRNIRPTLLNYDNLSKRAYNKYVRQIEKQVLELNDAGMLYQFSVDVDKGWNIKEVQKALLDKGMSYYLFIFAKNVKRADKKLIEDKIYASGNIDHIIRFGCEIDGADLNRAIPFILKSKKAKYAYLYLKYVKSPDVNIVKDIIIKSKRSRYLFELAKHLPEDERKLIEELIISNKSNTYVRLYARDVGSDDLKKFEQRIVKTGKVKEMEKFGKTVKNSKLGKYGFIF